MAARTGRPSPRTGAMCAALFMAMAFAAPGVSDARPPLLQSGNDLTAAERVVLDSGRQVVREDKVAGSAWPRVSVFQVVDATPVEAAAVFADYARHASYFPGIRRSTVSNVINPRLAEVSYLLDVPMYADEDYMVRDSVSTSGDGRYRVDWHMVRARSTKAIVGHAAFEPHRNALTGRDGTLITYVNLVTPGQLLAGPFKRRALSQVRETVVALVRQIQLQRERDPALLATQVAALKAAIGR